MAQPPMNTEQLFNLLRYDPETGVFVWTINQKRAGGLNREGYRRIQIQHHEYAEHRLAWLFAHGRWPSNLIDHIDGDKANNALSNLRECTNAENQQNRKQQIGSIGIRLVRNKWEARIRVNHKRYQIGTFDTKEEAQAAYCQAKQRLHPFNPEVRA